MLKFFRRLQWKISLSYALVTAGTVIVIAALLVLASILLESGSSQRTWNSMYWSKTAFQDNIPFLLSEPEALQTWLDRVQGQGFEPGDFQSYMVRESLAYANTLLTGQPIYVLDPDLKILAAAPGESGLVGRTFTRSVSGAGFESILEEAQLGHKNYGLQSVGYPDGTYAAAFPLRKTDEEPVTAIVVYHFAPPGPFTPANLDFYMTFLIVTSIIMFAVSLPVGAVFGWLVSRGLRKRLERLSAAAQAWSRGDFTAAPTDKSGDEIGELTRALNGMAGQLQTHIHTRDELARVEERNRLARDLHDTVKQQTYAARMQLSAAKNLLATQPQAAAEHLDAALQLNRETQQELKLIIDELRPAALEGRGLAQALAEYAARWKEHTGIRVEVTVTGERALPLAVEQALYRVLQEALSNIARHAEAEQVTLRLEIDPERARLVISDNGRGFEPAAVTPHSLGLTGMKERLAEVGGRLEVRTALAAGTTITAEVGR
jgi:signal transduction histidine kinase